MVSCTRLLALLVVLTASAAVAASLENPTCERLGPDRYRIDYQATPDSGAVEVFASSQPDSIDSPKAVLTIQRPPAEISLPGRTGRVYFHLKPASGPVRVVSIRRLPLEGAVNFRDLGGYRTTDGRYVRWGLVYRSNDLPNLTAIDYEYLRALRIRLVCDVRSERERTRSPTQWIGPAPEFVTAPIEPGGYEHYLTDHAAQYALILHHLIAGNLPAVEHCSGGKDRTGVFSAILLTALGVPRDVVIQDYLLTTQYVLAPDSIERTTADLQRILGLSQPPDAAYVRARMTTKPETLQAAFDNIERHYGSFDGYLHDGLKISDSELATLRERLLEP
jgi:protein-tyrosine phosphatase